ncbi:tol-pal system protein YbgF [Geomonas sp. Red32]|uniref:tol-pal system protein YbgF n=1 Tax=Geomonas sp. Red32 TaxID=2912856 RepID=UPI00202CA6DC|nr:tol-pal system protein YbgF [Geomonas sp. Red32]MCM0084006.1 tol-pal system protein YbgF [Geomonas sp. Red32]
MQALRVAGTSLIALALFGCASKADVDVMRRDNDEMKNRIFAMEKGLNEVRGDVKEGIEKSLAANRKSLETLQKDVGGYQKDMETIRKSAADLQATLDSSRVDMQVLTGKIDDVRILAQKPADDIALLKDDLNKRLAALEDRMAKLEAGLADQQKKAALAQQTPEWLYQQAQDAYKRGDVAKARESFGKFLETYPKHRLAANAHYWLGETYYSDKNYDQAVLEFQEVINNFPDNRDKVPAAMLKQGMAFKEMGDPKSAVYVYRKLIEEFPKSDEAKVAKEKLRSIK